jgi:peptidoglycan hydrolase CwlO-like protein|nr:MAG TPA: Flagella accessory protein C (FlaC) [Siphoviridae sp. ctX8T1]DAO14279.1 MAG TPA: Flagella accessory protein C (FlaC) [Caudoviricetes sp.]
MPNPVFTFTAQDILTMMLSVCGALVSISAAIAVVVKFNNFLKKPNKDQDARIDKLEGRLKTVEGRCDTFDKQLEGVKKHLNSLDESINMLLRAEFAQLGHNLNGDNVEQMQRAFDDIQEFLFKR